MCKRGMEDQLGTGRAGRVGIHLTLPWREMCYGFSGDQEGWHSSSCELFLRVKCWCCKFLQLCKETGTYPPATSPTCKQTDAPMWSLPTLLCRPSLTDLPCKGFLHRKCSKSDHKGHHPRDRQVSSQDKARGLLVSPQSLNSQWGGGLQRRPRLVPPSSPPFLQGRDWRLCLQSTY